MECFGKPVWTNYSEEELHQITIQPPDNVMRQKIQNNWDLVAKPLDGMGKFEPMVAQIGTIQQSEHPDVHKRAVLIFCADNGIVEEGVSQSGQEVTTMVARMMGQGNSSVGRLAKVAGADTIPIDIGIGSTDALSGVVDYKICPGTHNFSKEPAMSQQEAVKAIAVGIELVASCRQKGYRILATGEMGIGNTTTSSAVAAALLHCDVKTVTGRGAGLSDKGLLTKQKVIADAIQKYDLYHKTALQVLSIVGGLDLAGLAGVCIGGALYHVPIVLDGVISLSAALIAKRLFPGVEAYLLASHKGKEPAVNLLLPELQLDAVLDADMALGEGSGAVMLFPLLDMALSVYESSSTFADIHLQQYQRLDKKL